MTEKQKENPDSLRQSTPSEQTRTSLNVMLQDLKKWTPSKEKSDYMVDYILKLAQIESKYQSQKESIKKEVRFFIEASFWDKLYTHLWEYNIKKFDVDGTGKIDTQEEENYSKSMNEAISQMIILLWLDKFSQVHYESASKDGFLNLDKYLADIANLWNHVLWKKQGKNFMEKLLQTDGNITEEELHKMEENRFDPTDKESWRQMTILLVKEFWNGVEDVLRFIWNIPSGIILLPRYAAYRTLNVEDNLNLQNKTEVEIKLNELVRENPSLGLLELLGEKGVTMIKKLWEMFASGKQWDITALLVTIAWLIAGWAWATKLGLVLARKSAVNSAKIAGKEARIAGETVSKETRGLLKTRAEKTGKVAEVAGKVDDIIGGAGIGHLTGMHKWIKDEKRRKIQEKYLKQQEIISQIPQAVDEYLSTINISQYSNEQLNDIYNDILVRILHESDQLSESQKGIIKEKIQLYIERKKIIQKYFDEYQNNPKELLEKHLGISKHLIEKDISLELSWANIIFHIDPLEFNKIMSEWRDFWPNFGWGRFINTWSIVELKWCVIILSWNSDKAKIHELQHSRNWFTMPERFSEQNRTRPLSRAKDEIIAFLKDGTGLDDIRKLLHSSKYDFHVQINHNSNYSTMRENYLEQLDKYIDIAKSLIEKWASLEILEITPIEKWNRLDRVMKQIPSHIEKLKEFWDGTFAWKIEYGWWKVVQEWIFNTQRRLIRWIKIYANFYEEWTFSSSFWEPIKTYTWKWTPPFDSEKIINDYERDYKIYQIMKLLSKQVA